MGDARPEMGVALDAFGVPATITRPPPDDEPIETTIIWPGRLPMEVPGGEWSRQEPHRILAVSLSDVPTIPVGTRIAAPELLGQDPKIWQVDALMSLEADEARVLVVEIRE